MPVPRADRLLTLGLVRPLQQAAGNAEAAALPILMYHSISEDSRPGVPAYYQTTTTAAVFESHLRVLRAEGFRSASLEEAIPLLQAGAAEAANLVVITFDDGFRDFREAAFPLLQEHGHTATVFLPTAFIGEGRKTFKGRECMTWSEVRELRAHGIRFGSHTVNHPVLHDLPWKQIEGELARSRERLEQELGESITSFAYPYALPQEDRPFTRALAETLRSLGYRHGVTTRVGRAQPHDDPLLLKRLPANSGDDAAFLAAKLRGGYDWFAWPQAMVRRAKGWTRRTRPHPESLLRLAGRTRAGDSATGA